MGIDWRMGAEWFESCLLDYDPCSNYGNWTYGAGIQFFVHVMFIFLVQVLKCDLNFMHGVIFLSVSIFSSDKKRKGKGIC